MQDPKLNLEALRWAKQFYRGLIQHHILIANGSVADPCCARWYKGLEAVGADLNTANIQHFLARKTSAQITQ